MRSDDDLLTAARSGDRRALEALLTRHQAQVYRFGLRMCRDPEDAKDVLQDTLLAAARGVRSFRGASSFSTWLYAIARSACLKRRRRSKFAPTEEAQTLADEARLAHPGKAPDEVAAGRQTRRALERAIGELEPKYREVLVLRDVEGLSAPEVARVLGLRLEAVKSRLHRARLAVREQLAPTLAAAPRRAPCRDVLGLLSRHLEGEISAEVCASMERHVDGCARCRGACASLKRTLALCRASAPAVEVPPAVQTSVRRALRAVLSEKKS